MVTPTACAVRASHDQRCFMPRQIIKEQAQGEEGAGKGSQGGWVDGLCAWYALVSPLSPALIAIPAKTMSNRLSIETHM